MTEVAENHILLKLLNITVRILQTVTNKLTSCFNLNRDQKRFQLRPSVCRILLFLQKLLGDIMQETRALQYFSILKLKKYRRIPRARGC